MAAPGFTLGTFVFVLLVSSVVNYPNGKVTKSCRGMVPLHGHSPQSEPIHHIAVSQRKFRPGDRIEGTVLAVTTLILSSTLLLCIESLLIGFS
jgi:hypothetical protein